MTTKKPRLTIYLSQEKRDYLEQWAEKDKRTLSNLVGLLIDEAIEKHQEEVETKKQKPR
jgi:predicted DNA-binding protein